MRKDIVFTIEHNDISFDICTSLDMQVEDLKQILCKALKIDTYGVKLFSVNKNSLLSDEAKLYNESVWDGDILQITGG